ncbi:MAG: oligosaccharide flippase family protein [Candidatus Eisenbacteria bacterium]
MQAFVGSAPRQRVLRASLWSFALLIAEKLLGFARVIVLAALLSPLEFGLFGLAILTMMALDTMTRTGFQQALIRDPRDITRHLDVAWSVHLVRGLLLAALLVLIAPYVASYFEEPGAIRLTRAIALVLVFQSFSNIGVVYFQKELNFRKEFAFRLSGTLADLLTAAVAAWLLRSAWALLLGLVAGEVVRLIVSYVIHPYRPRLRFERQSLLELARYGIWISLSGMMLFLGTRAAGLVVGKVVGATALGLYQMAYRIPQIAIQEVSAAVERIALPTYSLVQHDLARLRRSYLGISGVCVALAAPAAIGIAALGGEFVGFFMREAWRPMVPALVLLAFSSLLRVISGTGVPLFQACGVPSISFYVQCVRALALAVFIYPLTHRWGISGTAVCMILTALAGTGVWLLGIRRVLGWRIRDLREGLLPPLISALAMGAVIYPLKLWTLPAVPEATFPRVAWMAGMILAGLAVYLASLWTSLRILPRSVLLDTAGEILRARGIPGGGANR